MSYILGALKKADQERRRENDVKISDWDQDSWDDPTPADNTSHWLLGLVGFGLVMVLAVFGFVAFQVLETVPTAQPVAAVESEAIESEPVAVRGAVRVEAATMPLESDQYPADAPVASANRIEQQAGMEKTHLDQSPDPGQADLADQPNMPDFSGHLYFPGNSGLSRVFANSSSYREGDTINGYRVEQILEDELVLSKGEQEIRINMRN
jgi:hypothetical protein